MIGDNLPETIEVDGVRFRRVGFNKVNRCRDGVRISGLVNNQPTQPGTVVGYFPTDFLPVMPPTKEGTLLGAGEDPSELRFSDGDVLTLPAGSVIRRFAFGMLLHFDEGDTSLRGVTLAVGTDTVASIIDKLLRCIRGKRTLPCKAGVCFESKED